MTKRYYVATVTCDVPLIDKRYIVHPDFSITEDSRTVDEIESSAAEKGYEVSYSAGYIGYIGEEISKALVRLISRDYHVKNQFDLEIDVVRIIRVAQ